MAMKGSEEPLVPIENLPEGPMAMRGSEEPMVPIEDLPEDPMATIGIKQPVAPIDNLPESPMATKRMVEEDRTMPGKVFTFGTRGIKREIPWLIGKTAYDIQEEVLAVWKRGNPKYSIGCVRWDESEVIPALAEKVAFGADSEDDVDVARPSSRRRLGFA